MAIRHGLDGSEPVPPDARDNRIQIEQERRRVGTGRVAVATLACPDCDAPVALSTGGAAPADPLACPYCGHAGAVRDFLSLDVPTRPTRVEVRVRTSLRRSAPRS